MDIIITSDIQGAGKTTAAETLIAHFRPPYGQRYSDNDVLYIHDAYFAPANLLTEMLRAARVRAVVFDGCITTPAEMLAAVAAVKAFRKQVNADVLAIYVAPGDAVMLTDGEIKRPGFSDNRFRECPPSQVMEESPNLTAEHIERRTDRILADLWDGVAEIADEATATRMREKLDNLVTFRNTGAPIETPGLHHLDHAGKLIMHEFLLTLLRGNGK